MFEKTLKTLNELSRGLSIPVSVATDDDGYFDRQCPSPDCRFLFKVKFDDWRDIVKDEAVWCPFCGHSAVAVEWNTPAQAESAKAAALAELKHRLNSSLRHDATQWNRRQPRNSFFSITMNVDAKPKEITLPACAIDPMQLKITCPNCTCRYAVIGSAYFCPSCGHNAADLVFDQSLGTIRATLDNLELIARAIPDRDTAENTRRVLIEDSLQRLVTAFQRYAEALYSKHPSAPLLRRNAFQNLAEGSAAWNAAFGAAYDAHLTAAELNTLNRYFQQRHLLAHKQGLVDADYIAKSGDINYREGRRIVVREAGTRECLGIVEKLMRALAQDAATALRP
jgi:uncharacterized Zn finger protein (UPF0148 family)